ncbi:hypothetical protein D3C72_2280550 [compost metagenome]
MIDSLELVAVLKNESSELLTVQEEMAVDYLKPREVRPIRFRVEAIDRPVASRELHLVQVDGQQA